MLHITAVQGQPTRNYDVSYYQRKKFPAVYQWKPILKIRKDRAIVLSNNSSNEEFML